MHPRSKLQGVYAMLLLELTEPIILRVVLRTAPYLADFALYRDFCFSRNNVCYNYGESCFPAEDGDLSPATMYASWVSSGAQFTETGLHCQYILASEVSQLSKLSQYLERSNSYPSERCPTWTRIQNRNSQGGAGRYGYRKEM